MLRSLLVLPLTLLLSISLYAQGSHPLFTLLSPQQTHVNFSNPIVDTKEHNVLIYSNYYGGAGVAVADFNRDGFQDIYFAGNLTGDRLYLNRGQKGAEPLEFEDITSAAGIVDNGGWSSGLAVGDVNNDGWPDIYVCRELYDDQPELRKNKLYINRGTLTPEGYPTFEECAAQYGVDHSERTRHATFLDYDRDGDLDLFLLNQPPNPGNFSDMYGTRPAPQYAPQLYRNDLRSSPDQNSELTFTDVTEAAGVQQPGYPNSVTASDLNNDGWTDLYVANDFDAPDFFYLNNGDGTFTNIIDSALQHISYYSMGVDAADINNDGWLDLMVLDMVAEDNFRLKANMSGMDPAAFWKVYNEGGHYQYMFNSLQLNVPRPTASASGPSEPLFSDIGQLADVSNTDWSWSNLIADFDNDGYKDIHVTNGLMRDIRNSDADKAFSHYVDSVARTFIQNNPDAGDVSIWEILDLEEVMEIVPSEKLANYVFRNNGGQPDGNLTFSNVTHDWGLDQKTFSHGSAYADFDNDGDLDLVISNVNDTAFVYRNNAEQNHQHYLQVVPTDSSLHRPVMGTRVQVTINDNHQWIEISNTRGMYSTSEAIAHFGVGEASVVDRLSIYWPDGSMTSFEQVPVDQRLVIDWGGTSVSPAPPVAASPTLFQATDEVRFRHQENEEDDYERQVLLPHKMSQFGPALAVGDVNGDGLDDCFVGGASGQSGVLFMQHDGGEWSPLAPLASDDALYEDMDAAFFDADNDGDLDLYVVSGGNSWPAQDKAYQDRLYLNDGQGKFSRNKKLPALTESGSCVRPFDFDKDGDLDLLVGGRHVPGQYPMPVTTRLLRNDQGVFKDVTKALAPDLQSIGMVTDAVWIDVDQDSHTDLVLVGEWMPITWIRYDGREFTNSTEQLGLSDSEGWWFSVAAADMDGDGDQDLIAGNLGLNYKYKATSEEPFEVHYDDFDGNGTNDIVLSYYNFGEQFPLRGRSCSSQQIPMIGKKFATYEGFAAADLVEVYGSDNLQSALHYQAKTFASAYLENQGQGKFTMRPLPTEAQLSSINDIVIEDFDEDGHSDVLVAGNLFVSEVETPRNDAGVGLLLAGNGKGDFRPIPADQSGILLPYDVKKLATATTPAAHLILCAVNDGPLRTFRWGGNRSGR